MAQYVHLDPSAFFLADRELKAVAVRTYEFVTNPGGQQLAVRPPRPCSSG